MECDESEKAVAGCRGAFVCLPPLLVSAWFAKKPQSGPLVESPEAGYRSPEAGFGNVSLSADFVMLPLPPHVPVDKQALHEEQDEARCAPANSTSRSEPPSLTPSTVARDSAYSLSSFEIKLPEHETEQQARIDDGRAVKGRVNWEVQEDEELWLQRNDEAAPRPPMLTSEPEQGRAQPFREYGGEIPYARAAVVYDVASSNYAHEPDSEAKRRDDDVIISTRPSSFEAVAAALADKAWRHPKTESRLRSRARVAKHVLVPEEAGLAGICGVSQAQSFVFEMRYAPERALPPDAPVNHQHKFDMALENLSKVGVRALPYKQGPPKPSRGAGRHTEQHYCHDPGERAEPCALAWHLAADSAIDEQVPVKQNIGHCPGHTLPQHARVSRSQFKLHSKYAYDPDFQWRDDDVSISTRRHAGVNAVWHAAWAYVSNNLAQMSDGFWGGNASGGEEAEKEMVVDAQVRSKHTQKAGQVCPFVCVMSASPLQSPLISLPVCQTVDLYVGDLSLDYWSRLEYRR